METRTKLRILAPLVNSFAGGCPALPLLFRDLRDNSVLDVQDYTPGALRRRRWDIIYVYWPEWLLDRSRGASFTLVDGMRIIAELRLAKMRGAKIVWHANNAVAHETDRIGVVDLFFRVFASLTDQLIAGTQTVLDDFIRQYPVLRGVDHRVIPLGHWRGIYEDDGVSQTEARDRLGLPQDRKIGLSLGMVRPYKNHLQLIRCFKTVAAADDSAFLLIAGKPWTSEIAARVERECRGLEDICLNLRYIPDEELQYYLRASDFFIAPTLFATTSGSAMLALAFDLPILLPHRAEYIEWRELLGPEWVRTYEGGFRPSVLKEAFAMERPAGRPALERYFDWECAGRELCEALFDIATARDRRTT